VSTATNFMRKVKRSRARRESLQRLYLMSSEVIRLQSRLKWWQVAFCAYAWGVLLLEVLR